MVLDDLGAEVPVRDRARRIVSLVPSLTEAVASIAADRIVGATDYCTEPATLDVPRVGGSKYPTVSRILDCEPDLVVANSEENRREEVDALRAAGVPVWVTAAPATVDAALTSLQRLFTECLGERAPDWLAAARRRWARSVPRWACAVIPVWRKPWVVIGRDTFAADVLLRLGVGNAYA
ncbi:MAG: helical backbone metal receptor, partial [Sciscionella sp.]